MIGGALLDKLALGRPCVELLKVGVSLERGDGKTDE